MAEIINLREFRKSRDRKSKATRAKQNRAVSGRSKIERETDRDAAERAKAEIDAKKLDRGDNAPDQPVEPE